MDHERISTSLNSVEIEEDKKKDEKAHLRKLKQDETVLNGRKGFVASVGRT